MKEIDLIKYIKDFPYWKYFKKQIYYIINPIAHTKHVIKEFKKLKEEDQTRN